MLCCSSLGLGQDVEVHGTKGGIVLSVNAQQSYQLIPGETKLPILSVQCLHKGSKASHLVIFLPGGEVVDENPDAGGKVDKVFPVTINGKKHMAHWVIYTDTLSYAYFARTDAERMEFLQSLLSSPTVAIEFRPFLTGTPTTAVFDLSKLREELDKHPECGKP